MNPPAKSAPESATVIDVDPVIGHSRRSESSDGSGLASASRPTGKPQRKVDRASQEWDAPSAEMEFKQAVETYKAASGRMYPTWSEVLEVLSKLGYGKPV